MLTLRNGSNYGKSLPQNPYIDPGNCLFTVLNPCSWGHLLAANDSCPHCGRNLTNHHFSTSDGLAIVTYHCTEHGDVIPLREANVRDDSITEEKK